MKEELTIVEKQELWALCQHKSNEIESMLPEFKDLDLKTEMIAEMVYYQNLRDKLERIINYNNPRQIGAHFNSK